MDISIWKDAYQIGVEPIDQQHKQLLAQAEKIQRALRLEDETQRRAECENAISFAKHYTTVHFVAEEHLQEKSNFAQRDAHKQLHQNFIQELEAFESRLAASNYAADDVQAFAEMFSEWFIYHISGEDKKMVGFLYHQD